MNNKWSSRFYLISLLSFILLHVAFAQGAPDPIWHTSLDDLASITVDGGAIVSGPASFVPGAIDNAFAGNGSVYATWDDSNIGSIFSGWDNGAGITVDLYFRGDHWSSHSGDSGFWSIARRSSDQYIILSVRDGNLRIPFRDANGEYKYHLTGIPLANNVTYRVTVRQYNGAFDVYLDGGAYSNATPVFVASDLPTGYTWNFVSSGGSPPREMNIGNRAIFDGKLQSGEWVDNVRVFNGFYSPADIDDPVDDECPESDIDDDCDVDVFDLQYFTEQWLGMGLPVQGLISHWKLDGNSNDNIGGNDGTVYGNPIWDSNGYIDGALNFDGDDDYIDLGNSSSLKPNLPISLSAWIKLAQTGMFQVIINTDKKDYDADHRIYGAQLLVWDTGKLSISFGDGQLDYSGRRFDGTTTLQSDIWYHIAAVIRAPEDISLYVDGRDDGGEILGAGGTIVYSDGASQIGCRSGDILFFDGEIDDVRIYDRSLSPDEIRALAYEADFNDDGRMNLNDFSILASEWLVGTQVSFIQQPENLTIYEGNTATFRVATEGAEPFSYQWQKNTIDLSDGGDISGATTDMLQIANTEASDEGPYRCVVSNKYNSVISDVATLTVIPGAPVGRQTLYEANTNRRYILYVPTDYNPPQKLYPLIISSHGTSQNGDTEMDSTGPNSGFDRGTPTWPTLAEENDVIIACPDMTGAYGNPDNQLAPGQLAQLASDDNAIMNIISEIQATYEIDTQRILITGFSGGGHVAHYTGLRHPDIFKSLCARHGNYNVEEIPNPLPNGTLNMNVYIFTGTNDAVYGTSEAIAWYAAQGFNYVDTEYFSTYPSSEHTTDRHHALDWFLNLNLDVSASGHYVRYNGETLMLVGDSGTQCAAQNSNLDHREWIDDCANRGIRAVHIWSFVPVRQKQDASQIEDRWGYVIPDVVPWARKTSGPSALDQRYQWDLQDYDEGAEGDMTRYWPRLRDMCSYAKSKNVVVGITMFTGWSKHDYSWIFHPLNSSNGGHLTNKADAVIIDTPGTEVWQESYSDTWSNAKKTQWVWEQMSIKFINELGPLGNVFFVFFDEHSYSEGNMGDHFRDFFRSRGQVWMDWNARRSSIDWVMSGTFSGDDRNSNAVSGFNSNPARPYFNIEGSPYSGSGVRMAIWTFSIGCGNYLFHADENQETVRTGIMGYDPFVPNGDKGMYRRDWLGHASTFFNQHVDDLDSLAPANGLTSSTPETYCLADNGREYVVYSKIAAATNFTLDLSAASGKILNCRFYNPRTGVFNSTFQRTGGNSTELFTKPDLDDWVLHVVEN